MTTTGAPWPAQPASAPTGTAYDPYTTGAWLPTPPSRGGVTARWIAGALALVAALALGASGGFGLWYDAWLDENGVRVDATVVQSSYDRVVVEYPVEGEGTVQGELYFATPAEGDVVAVEYDPDDPTYVRPVDSSEDTVLGGLALGGAVLLLLATAGLWWWAVTAGRTRERLLTGSRPYPSPSPYGTPGAYGAYGQPAPYVASPPYGHAPSGHPPYGHPPSTQQPSTQQPPYAYQPPSPQPPAHERRPPHGQAPSDDRTPPAPPPPAPPAPRPPASWGTPPA